MKTIIITGAASGIGKATAQRLLNRGWFVGLFDINREALEEFQAKCNAGNCSVHIADVADAASMRGAIADFVQKAGHLDAIFNCAGIMDLEKFENIPLERHQLAIDINVRGVVNGCHLAFPYLKQRSESWVISMSSASSIYGIPTLANYSATKFFVKGLTEALNIEWQALGIHVAAIEPPFVKTPLLEGNEGTIVDRLGVNLHADDIARMVEEALGNKRVHHPVSMRYRLLRWVSKVTPTAFTRMMIKYLAAY